MRCLTLILASLLTATCVFAEIPNGDVNCDDIVDIDDVVYTIQYIFASGPPPCSAPPPARITLISGDGQIDSLNTLLSEPFVIQVLDSTMQPLDNVPIAWEVISGLGIISDQMIVTDDQGFSDALYMLGYTPETNVVRATVFTADSLYVDFTADVYVPDFAIFFDGSERMITIPDQAAFDFSAGITVEMWVNSDWVSGITRTLISQKNTSNDWAFKIHYSTGMLRAYKYPQISQAVYYGSLPSLQWVHISWTYSDVGGVLYVSGEPVATSPYTTPIADTDGVIVLGNNNVLGESLRGTIDEVRIWNYVRSQEEIQTNMYNCLTGDESGLAAYFKFSQYPDQNLFDQSTGMLGGYLGISPVEDIYDPEFIESDAPVTP